MLGSRARWNSVQGASPLPRETLPYPNSSVILVNNLVLLPYRSGEGPGPALCQVWKPLWPAAQCG